VISRFIRIRHRWELAIDTVIRRTICVARQQYSVDSGITTGDRSLIGAAVVGS